MLESFSFPVQFPPHVLFPECTLDCPSARRAGVKKLRDKGLLVNGTAGTYLTPSTHLYYPDTPCGYPYTPLN